MNGHASPLCPLSASFILSLQAALRVWRYRIVVSGTGRLQERSICHSHGCVVVSACLIGKQCAVGHRKLRWIASGRCMSSPRAAFSLVYVADSAHAMGSGLSLM